MLGKQLMVFFKLRFRSSIRLDNSFGRRRLSGISRIAYFPLYFLRDEVSRARVSYIRTEYILYRTRDVQLWRSCRTMRVLLPNPKVHDGQTSLKRYVRRYGAFAVQQL